MWPLYSDFLTSIRAFFPDLLILLYLNYSFLRFKLENRVSICVVGINANSVLLNGSTETAL